ncbi:hypothetical protein [Methanoculleus formosensis]|uniref:hypothetical protein n=1 Tax=Methanoculleus formosensis TaxID=2590886 RepID=UPI0021C215A6|nr:hypothetical protein [Methanoculleus sp. Afa-1]
MSVPVTFASFEARGSFTDRGTGGAGQDAVRARERLHQEVEVRDAPLDKRHPGVIEEVLDVLPAWHGREVVDDDDVVVLCQRIRKVRARPAPPVTM